MSRFLPPASRVDDFAEGKVKELVGLRGGPLREAASARGGRGGLLLTRRLTNRSGRTLAFLFGSEFLLRLKDAHVNRVGEAAGVRRFEVVDPAARMRVGWRFSRPARLWYFPVEGRLNRGSRAERVYRGVCLTPVWPVRLPPGASWAVRLELAGGRVDG